MTRAAEISAAFVRSQPDSAARALDHVSPADVAAFIASVGEVEGAEVIARMQPSRGADILEQLAPPRAASLLHHAPPHVRSVLMRALSTTAQQAILKAAPRRQAAVLSRFLSYDPATVGAWMDAPSATFAPETKVSDCLRQLRGLGRNPGSCVHVIGSERQFLGVVELDGLIAAGDDDVLGEIMRRDIFTIAPQASLASVVALEAWDTALALPVTDRRRALVGSLRFDSLREALDIHHRTGGGPQLNVVVMHMTQAFLVSLSGLLQVATTEPSLSRLSNDHEPLQESRQ
jgi:Mg/Co/Ni transporter MgtE